MRPLAVLLAVLLGAVAAPPPLTAQPATITIAPYRGIEIPWLFGWEVRAKTIPPSVVAYDLRSDELGAFVQMRARAAVSGDVSSIETLRKELESSPVPRGRSRKFYTFRGGFVVVLTGRNDMQARAVLIVDDARGTSYVSMIGRWPPSSQFRIAIAAMRFIEGVENR